MASASYSAGIASSGNNGPIRHFGGPLAPWNIPATRLPTDPNSSLLVNKLWEHTGGNFNLNSDKWTVAIYDAAEVTSQVSIEAKYPDWGNLHGRTAPRNSAWQIPDDSDAMLAVVDFDTGLSREYWGNTRHSNGKFLVVYFGHDRTDSKLISRIEHLGKLGFQVFALTYHRVKFNRSYEPEWDNIDLGRTSDYAYLRRLRSLVSGALRPIPHRRRLAKADVVFARNIDMVLLARLIAGSKAPIAYEVLDVHRLFLGKGKRHLALRALERWVLRKVDALIVSSEVYILNCFEPVQNYQGPWFLLENKVPVGSVLPRTEPPVHRPNTLGRP